MPVDLLMDETQAEEKIFAARENKEYLSIEVRVMTGTLPPYLPQQEQHALLTALVIHQVLCPGG